MQPIAERIVSKYRKFLLQTPAMQIPLTHDLSYPIVSPNATVSFEADGGIPNPACQDADAADDKSEEQPKLRRPEVRVESANNIGKKPSKLQSRNTGTAAVMDVFRSRALWRFLGNALITISVLVILGFVEFGLVPQQNFGFYCDDPKVSHKYTGDTISLWVLIVGSLAIPFVVMWGTEWIFHNSGSYPKLSNCGLGNRSQQIWVWYGQYLVGIIALALICDVMKVVIGEPRPHFFDTCQPRELTNCTSEYVHDYTCTNTDDSYRFVSDSSKSFPSGHSAFSTFTATYVIWYLQVRMPNRMSTIVVKPWLQCLVMFWCIVCSLTRITDKRHHWWDVLAGFTMGIVFGVFTVRVSCRKFLAEESSGGLKSEPLENGQVQYLDKRHRSIRKLLSDASVECNTETRELGNLSTVWNG